MATVKLSVYAANKTQVDVAEDIGVTRAAISLMLLGDREIYVETNRGGFVKAWEKRPIPARRSGPEPARGE